MNKLLGNKEKGSVFIVSAPAGTGKTTLVQMLTKEFSCVIESVSYTTRKPRLEEKEGKHYHFIEVKEFKRKVEKNEFLEYVELYGDYYGTSRSWVEKKLNKGYHVILVIDTQGAIKLKKIIDAVLIFIRPPSIEELRERMIRRQTENKDVIAKRLSIAEKEINQSIHYDYEIVNDDLSLAYQVLKSILIAEEHRRINGTKRNK